MKAAVYTRYCAPRVVQLAEVAVGSEVSRFNVGDAIIALTGMAMGAHITAVWSNNNRDLVRRLGGDEVVDYQREDFTRSGERYDLIMDTQGNAPWDESCSALAPRGRLLAVCATLPQMLQSLYLPLWERERAMAAKLIPPFGKAKHQLRQCNHTGTTFMGCLQ